jgi:hypothetical protein
MQQAREREFVFAVLGPVVAAKHGLHLLPESGADERPRGRYRPNRGFSFPPKSGNFLGVNTACVPVFSLFDQYSSVVTQPYKAWL